jgi:two-component system LytT family response regulator
MIKAILVDDEAHCLGTLSILLKEYCPEVQIVDKCRSAKAALEAIEKLKPSLVFLDIEMPGMNGFSLYREIKRLDKGLKICFLTAGEMYYGVYSDILSSLPADHFIRKPIENQELLYRINEILGGTVDVAKGNSSWIESII